MFKLNQIHIIHAGGYDPEKPREEQIDPTLEPEPEPAGPLFDEETCRVCGCTDTQGCVMVFSDLAQRRHFVERYALASAIELTENDVRSSSINLMTVEHDDENLPAAVCWWFADEVCVACAAELDQAMSILGEKGEDGEAACSLEGAIEIKAGHDCYPDACDAYPTLRDMRTWAPPAATVDEVLHELPALLELWAAEEADIMAPRCVELETGDGHTIRVQGQPSSPESQAALLEVITAAQAAEISRLTPEDQPQRLQGSWMVVGVDHGEPGGTSVVRRVLSHIPTSILEAAYEQRLAEEEVVGGDEFEGGPFELAPDDYGADDPPSYWTAIELGTAAPCALCKHGAHLPGQCAGPEHEGVLDWGCECQYGHEEGDETQTIGHMLDLLRERRRTWYMNEQTVPTRAELTHLLGCTDATIDALLKLLDKEGQALALHPTNIPRLEIRPEVWIYDDAGARVGYVKRIEKGMGYGELTGNLGRLELTDQTPVWVRCVVRPATGRVQCSVNTIPSTGRATIGFVDWPPSLERPAQVEVPDCIELTTQVLGALLLTIPGEVKCVACHGSGEACSRCDGSTREEARRTKDGGFFCNRCFVHIPLYRIRMSLEKYPSNGFIICPRCEVCYHAHDTTLPGVDLLWWKDQSSVYGALRSREGKTWGFDDELLPYFKNYPHITAERLRDVLEELQRQGKAEIDTVKHGWRDAKGMPLKMSACRKNGEHLGDGWCKCDTVPPEGKKCGDCIHFNRCVNIFQCPASNTQCEWSPSRFAPKAFPEETPAEAE